MRLPPETYPRPFPHCRPPRNSQNQHPSPRRRRRSKKSLRHILPPSTPQYISYLNLNAHPFALSSPQPQLHHTKSFKPSRERRRTTRHPQRHQLNLRLRPAQAMDTVTRTRLSSEGKRDLASRSLKVRPVSMRCSQQLANGTQRWKQSYNHIAAQRSASNQVCTIWKGVHAIGTPRAQLTQGTQATQGYRGDGYPRRNISVSQ